MHIIAAKAICFKEALQPSFKEYARQIIANAKTQGAGISALGITIRCKVCLCPALQNPRTRRAR